MKINSHNEWDRLREIIVGSATGTSAVIEWHRSESLNTKVYKEAIELCKKATPKKVLDETNEDLEDLAKVLRNWGAKVLRPNVHDISKTFQGFKIFKLQLPLKTTNKIFFSSFGFFNK